MRLFTDQRRFNLKVTEAIEAMEARLSRLEADDRRRAERGPPH
jgi:hypothetical protein